ncbi:GNAT family N-acetyltransferase [Halarcobacter sp.]|uniref:GNAT family N-acetyltransferase n=1 Tax=Halarcobacter sp. TaxID=2321133 RepID=UPI002AAB722B|nr:GNAT family N-acetyltransferase [Halarcobacter sp.]
MKYLSSPQYTIRLFKNSKSEDFIEALSIYSEEMPSELRTSSNEIIYWIDNYSKLYKDQLLIFGFYENDKLIGFSQCVYFSEKKFITIDYFVISSTHRGNHSFQMIVALLKDFLKTYEFEYNFIVTEVELKNKSLFQLLKINGFGEIKSKYFQPYLGNNNHDSLIEAKLLYFPAYEDKIISKETYKMIIETLYDNHYIRWYSGFLSKKEMKEYEKMINNLKIKIFNKLHNQINITGGKKSINDYSEFDTQKEIKLTAIILSIICIFAFFTLILGKSFNMTTSQIVIFIIIDLAMFFLVYSLVSKKGIEQFKLLLKLFYKVK